MFQLFWNYAPVEAPTSLFDLNHGFKGEVLHYPQLAG